MYSRCIIPIKFRNHLQDISLWHKYFFYIKMLAHCIWRGHEKIFIRVDLVKNINILYFTIVIYPLFE